MKARAFFRTSKLMLPGVVLGAKYSPGFTEDLSSWRLGIDDEGHLFQDMDFRRYSAELGVNQERRQHQVHLGIEAVLRLMVQAEEIGFSEFQDFYEASISDQATQTISIRYGGLDKTVRVYGAVCLAQEGNVEAQRFLELWNAVHESVPGF